MRPHRLLLAAALLASFPTAAAANGRFPATVHVQSVPGDNQSIFLPTTFGLLISDDDGASFHWICENAIGYTGIYDPDYALTSDGSIWATTFQGLRVTHDGGCNWTTIAGPLDGRYIGEVEIGPDGTIWATTSDGDKTNDVFKSTNGTDFTATNLSDGMAWWRTLRIAPTDAQRIYVAGFQPSQPMGDAMTPAEALAYRSDNAGGSWQKLDLTDIEFAAVPEIEFLATAPDDPDTIYAVSVGVNAPTGDRLYVSHDAGANWQALLDMNDTIVAFLVLGTGPNYEIHVGTVGDGNRTSTDGGANWNSSDTPRQACIEKRADGTYFSCGANWDPDFFALGRSTDGQSWQKVMRFVDIAGPVSCPPGTVQFDICESQVWPDLAQMFGIGAADAGPSPPDAGGNGGDSGGGGGGGCCDGGAGSSSALALAMLVGLLLLRRRRTA